MTVPTKEQVRALTTKAARMTVEEFKIEGFAIPKNIEESITDRYLFIHYLVKFAQEAEREACAKVCENLEPPERHEGSWTAGWCEGTNDCAAAIRSRGNT